MLFLITGAPSAPALFAVETVRALAETAYGAVAYGHVSTLEQLHAAVRGRAGKALVVFLETPERRIAELLARSRFKIALFEDDLEPVTAFLMAQHRSEFRGAARYAALSAASLATLRAHCDVSSFPPPAEGARLLSFIQSVALFYGFQPDTALVEGVAGRLDLRKGLARRAGLRDAIETRFPAAGAAGRLLDALPPFERRILAELAPGYDALGARTKAEEIDWPPGFCLSGDRLDEPLRNPIDMTGPARALSYGPYLHLPVGPWEMTVILDVSANHSGNALEITVTESGALRASETFALPDKARVEARLPLRVEDPRGPLELYVKTREGAIEGALSLHAVRFRRPDGADALLPS